MEGFIPICIKALSEMDEISLGDVIEIVGPMLINGNHFFNTKLLIYSALQELSTRISLYEYTDRYSQVCKTSQLNLDSGLNHADYFSPL